MSIPRSVRPAMFFLLFAAPEAYAESSCLLGLPVCLSRYDTVCGVGQKCVEETSTCFPILSCDSSGFVCRSELDESKDNERALRTKFDELADTCINLRVEAEKLKREGEPSAYDVLLLQDEIEKMRLCVAAATSLDAARECAS